MQSGWDRLDLTKNNYKVGNWDLVAKLFGNPNQQNGYAPGVRVLAWNPCFDLDIGGGERQSPAMGISHEVIHGEREELGIFIPLNTEFPWDMILLKPLFHQLDEMPTIRDESIVARDLGEPIRADHNGVFKPALPRPPLKRRLP